MNRSLEQGKAVLSQTNREGTSIEMELRNMDDHQVLFFCFGLESALSLYLIFRLKMCLIIVRKHY